MSGDKNTYLIDINLPRAWKFGKYIYQVDIDRTENDSLIWDKALSLDWVIVSKDADFYDKMMLLSSPPPKLVHIRVGNMKLSAFKAFISLYWPQIETLLETHRIIIVEPTRIVGLN